MQNTVIVVHYDEIATKGLNRKFFEQKLKDNIKQKLLKKVKKVKKIHGKFIITPKSDLEEITSQLKKIPGIANFSEAIESSLDLKKIEKDAIKLTKSKKFKSFRIKAQRTNKKFPLTSPQINEKLGKTIQEKLKKQVKLKNPDLTIYVEISDSESFIYTKKTEGIRGLPSGTMGNVISSLSGGIDSPVASFLAMKRGAEVTLVHFHNKTINPLPVLKKIESLAKIISTYQQKTKLYIVPFDKIQKTIIKHVPSDSRMIVYRRFMNKILNEIAKKEKASAIITGDNLGQVASQTLENLKCIHESSDLPILSPLIALNKSEIIQIAKKIQTFETSILPYEDCCSFLTTKHPKTKASLHSIKKIELKIPSQKNLIKETIKKSDLSVF